MLAGVLVNGLVRFVSPSHSLAADRGEFLSNDVADLHLILD